AASPSQQAPSPTPVSPPLKSRRGLRGPLGWIDDKDRWRWQRAHRAPFWRSTMIDHAGTSLKTRMVGLIIIGLGLALPGRLKAQAPGPPARPISYYTDNDFSDIEKEIIGRAMNQLAAALFTKPTLTNVGNAQYSLISGDYPKVVAGSYEETDERSFSLMWA